MSAVPVVLFADFTCPYSYVTEAALGRMADAGEVRVDARAYELYPAPHPLPPSTGEWAEALAPIARAVEVALRVPDRVVRTRKAHEAAAFAARRGVGPGMRSALYAAHFAEGRDIGRIDVLVEIGAALGLDRSETKVVLDVDRYAASVRADAALARRAGIEGVPTIVADAGSAARVLVGARAPAVLRDEILGG